MYLTCLLPLLGLAVASPVLDMRAVKPAAFFLAGDSTTATLSGSGGGWGDGFLSTLVNGATGQNFGYNGATTVSFVSGGDWANVLAAVDDNKASYDCHVTIQFGHNDQKPASNITVEEYSTNLKNMANDVISAGGTPILVTPLSRRTFSSSTGKVNENLATQAEATRSVSSTNGFDIIDLNRNSTSYLNAIGEADSQLYNRIENDTTHLNAAGGLLFGNMVSELILQMDASLGEWLSPNATIVEDIEAGIFILPSTS